MAGANALMNSPAFTMSKSPMPSAGRPAAASEPPPVKRDLKPGRKSLGSDSGLSETRYCCEKTCYPVKIKTPKVFW